MRRWEIRQGNYIGFHYIYDNEQEAAVCLGIPELKVPNKSFVLNEIGMIVACIPTDSIDETFRHWTHRDNRKNDWVRTDDGRICQILDWRIMKQAKLRGDRRYKTYGEHPYPMIGDSVYYRLPFTSGVTYLKADGTISYKYIHADFFVKGAWNNPRRSSIAGTVKINKVNSTMSMNKRLFAYYCAVTNNPIKAYHLVFPGHYTNKAMFTQITKRAITMFKDRFVLQELMTYMTIEEYQKKAEKALEDTGLDLGYVFEEIKRGTTGAKAGSVEHQDMIKMSVEVYEKVIGTPLITTSLVQNKTEQDKLPPGYTSGNVSIPLPNKEIYEEVKKKTPELADMLPKPD